METILESPNLLSWLADVKVADAPRAKTNLVKIFRGLPADLIDQITRQMRAQLPMISDPDMAINNLERFFSSARSKLSLAALFDREPTTMPVLLRIFSASQYLSDLLVNDPEAYDILRMTEGQPHRLDVLIDDLMVEIESCADMRQAMRALRRYKHRETLRVAFGDLIVMQRLPVVCEQISFVAQAICQAAYTFCLRQLVDKWGVPQDSDGEPIPFAVLALGKLGASELNYSSDIDLVMVYRTHGNCSGTRHRMADQFFEELTRNMVKSISEPTDVGFAYRVDLRLRPEGSRGRLCNPLPGFLRYYELQGRAWERQAMIKARPVAGDLAFGAEVIRNLQPWIYRRSLNRFDITAIKSLKRQMERRARSEGAEQLDIKTGHGGIRDIEYVIQFLQLLNGDRLPEIRVPGTLTAIERLQRAGCLSLDEETTLTKNYIWLRKLEHCLQIMFDLQTHRLPSNIRELKKMAMRMGYFDSDNASALDAFRRDFDQVTYENRQILDHLMHSAFSDDATQKIPLAVDLVFAQDPSDDAIQEALDEYRFDNSAIAAQHLMALSTESVPFLSPYRCRHFLAAIVPRLLKTIRETPQPDTTMAALRVVADALGAKGVLWELFNSQPAALKLFVRLCAGAGYLVGILRENPGMIDELVDALLMDQLPNRAWLSRHLAELAHGAVEVDPIVYSFKQAQHLRVGVLDLLGKYSVIDVGMALSQIADVILDFATRRLYAKSLPKSVKNESIGAIAESMPLAVLACGKLGARELNYQSDLDLVFLYRSQNRNDSGLQHKMSQVASEILKFLTNPGRFGRLYEVDCRLRPTGKSGPLATSLDAFVHYFSTGGGQTWERLALCRSRIAVAELDMRRETEQAIQRAIQTRPWSSKDADEIYQMRIRMQHEAAPNDLKRGNGGIVDIEFLIQTLQLKYCRQSPDLLFRQPLDVLNRLGTEEWIHPEDLTTLRENYVLLRRIESALTLAKMTRENVMVLDDKNVQRVAFLMKWPVAEELPLAAESARRRNRQLFDHYFRQIR